MGVRKNASGIITPNIEADTGFASFHISSITHKGMPIKVNKIINPIAVINIIIINEIESGKIPYLSMFEKIKNVANNIAANIGAKTPAKMALSQEMRQFLFMVAPRNAAHAGD
jgi:hypothetical protein